jgi:hypothetical protein
MGLIISGGGGTPADGSITSAKIADDSIVNADVKSDAAIAQSKVATLVTDLAALSPWRIDIVPLTASGHTNFTNIFYAAVQAAVSRGSTGAQNAEIYWDLLLSAGTWTFSLVHNKNTDQGIYSVQLDAVEVGTIDAYNAGGSTNNNISAVTGIVVASTGVKRVKLKMATKNASSSNYYGTFQFLSLHRTA